MKRIIRILKGLKINCKLRKNKEFGFYALCFKKKPERRVINKINKEFKRRGYNSSCGIKEMYVFCKKRHQIRLTIP